MHPSSNASISVAVVSLCIVGLACQPSRPSTGEAAAGIDSLNAALVRAYRSHDPRAYAALYTDTAGFEWPAFHNVWGPAELAAEARSKWASLSGIGLRLTGAARPRPPRSSTLVMGVQPIPLGTRG